jgi:hypothetical protein
MICSMRYKSSLLCLFCVSILHAQRLLPTPSKKNCTLFDYYNLTMKYSLNGDSINASSCLLKINPYYFLCEEDATKETIDSIISKFLITKETKAVYRRMFAKIFDTPKTKAFLEFKTILKEDQEIRNKIDDCKDSSTCTKFWKQMRTIDSMHFTYLRKYILRYGWPNLENGSLYAQIIALHNHRGYDYLMPIIKSAVSTGLVAPSTYNAMEYYKKKERQRFETISFGEKSMVIDCSYILDGIEPDHVSFRLIKELTEQRCPIKRVYTVFEVCDSNEYIKMCDDKNGAILEKISKILDAIDVKCWEKSGISSVYWVETKDGKKRGECKVNCVRSFIMC